MSDKPPAKHNAHGNYRRADWFEARCAKLEVALRELEAQCAAKDSVIATYELATFGLLHSELPR